MADGQRARYSANTWRQWIEEQRSSGQGEAAFCAARGLKKSTLQTWKRRLYGTRSLPIPADTAGCAQAGGALFMPLTQPEAEPPRSSATGWTVELELGGGLCLRLRRDA